MVEILEALPNLGGIPLLVELIGSCPTFSGGNWGKVFLVITFSLLNLFERFFFLFHIFSSFWTPWHRFQSHWSSFLTYLASEKLFEPLGPFWVLSLVELWLTFFGEPKVIFNYLLHYRAIGIGISSFLAENL